MKRAIIIHGMCSRNEYYTVGNNSPSNSHWLPWLQQQLCRQNILTQTPEMPYPFEPNYNNWKTEFELLRPDEETLLIGHSCGGGFLTRWLSEDPKLKVGRVILVAPWLDIEKRCGLLFDFMLRRDIAQQSIDGIDVLYSTNDMLEIESSLEYLNQNTENLRYHKFVDYGHFCASDIKTQEFPELLKICQSNLNDSYIPFSPNKR